MPLTLKNWRAKRAGAAITVYGEDTTTKHEIKITRIQHIKPGMDCCIATGHDGLQHTLRTR